MQILLVAAIAIVSLIVVFAVQNAGVVQVTLFAWNYEMALSLLLLVTFVSGAVAGVLASIPNWVRKKRTINEQKRVIEDMKNQERQNVPVVK